MSGYSPNQTGRVLHRMERWLPRRLTTRVTMAVVIIVVAAGLTTTGAINLLLVRNLRAESVASGQALTLALGESLANALVEGDLAAIQEAINGAVQKNENIVYAFAFGPGAPIVHSFPGGFPADLLQLSPVDDNQPGEGVLLRTDLGLVRDFGYRPLDGLPAEVHLGLSQERIVAVQRQVTGFVLALTLVGCLVAAAIAYSLSRLATYPLTELTRRVQRLGRGRLDERIDLPPGDEVGDLALAFNQMAADIQGAIQRLQASEAGYRDLLTAAGAVGEGIALIGDDGSLEGSFLFVNEAFAQVAGYQPEELLGVNAASVLHPDSLDAAHAAWEDIRTGVMSQAPGELTLVDRRGRKRILETTGVLIEYQEQRALAWFTRDITERKAREQELRRRNRELKALNAVASAMSTPVSADEMLSRTLQQMLTALELRVGWIITLDENGQTRLAASQGLNEPEQQVIAFPECRCGMALIQGTPTIVYPTEERCILHRLLAEEERGLTCHAAAPVQARDQVLGILSVAAAGPQAIDQADITLLEAVGRQIGVALENARLWEELRRKEQIRGELLAQVIRAQEEERQRIARELHDGIGQSLNALVFGLNAVSTALEQAPQVASELTERLTVSVSDTVKELQDVIYDLRPSLLDDLGLCRALRWYMQERLQSRGVRVILDAPETLRLPPDAETTLFRIAQEATTNVIKHAQARQMGVTLDAAPAQVRMEIWDDGVGFDPRATLAGDNGRRGWGLLGMQERVALLGGEFTVESQPGAGSRLTVILPLEAANI